MDFIKVVEKLLPPMSPLQTWRVIVVIMLMALGIHAAWAIGWIPGLDGFAQQSQVRHVEAKIEENRELWTDSFNQVQGTQNAILVRLISSDIELARARQCEAIKSGNGQAAEGWRSRVTAALYEYRASARLEYPLRPCSDY